ncbi:MAG: transcriptional regulator, partial [Mucilaginibacter sp.]|nr:transcriptional regulator [Mucilaginibacter sp.]
MKLNKLVPDIFFSILLYTSKVNFSYVCLPYQLAVQQKRYPLFYTCISFFRSVDMKKKLLLFFAIISFSTSNGQNQIGLPEIVTYTNRDYKAGVQNWDIQQDKNGILYFADYEGLLTYNGKAWNLFPLPNNTVVRSVAIGTDGKVFVGAQDALGYFFPEENGVLKYHSLKNLIPVKERKFADIWNIVIIKDQVFFRGDDKLFQMANGKINVFKSATTWGYSANVNECLYVQDRSKGLIRLNNGNWEMVCHDPALIHEQITSILKYDNKTLLITTLKSGLFLLRDSTLSVKHIAKQYNPFADRVYCAIKVNTDWFALGTTSGDCYIIDHAGNVVQKFTFQGGGIRKIFIDTNSNLWFSLDEGINFVALNSAIKNIYPNPSKRASAYAIEIFNSKLYIGTSNGLFSCPLDLTEKDLSYSKGNFTEYNKAKGQVWGLSSINNKLLIAHEDGHFILKNNEIEKFQGSVSSWLFEPLNTRKPTTEIIAGTYDGMHYLQYINNQFIDKGHIDGLTEPLRFIKQDNKTGIIWASHPYRGIYKIQLDSTKRKILAYKLYTDKNGLPSALNNYVFEVWGKILMATQKGIYEYDASKDILVPSAFLKNLFNNKNIEYLTGDKNGNVWFVADKRVGIADFSKHTLNQPYKVIYFPELTSRLISRFERIYPYDPENIFITCDKGVVHLNYKKYTENLNTNHIILTNVKCFGTKDSTLYGGYFTDNNRIKGMQTDDKDIKIAHAQNSLHFEYASTSFHHQNNIEYSYKLIGFDDKWSSWTDKDEKDYTNLPPQKFTFAVRSRNSLDNISKPVFFSFSITPAWYQTIYAYLLYLLLIIGIVDLLIKWQKKKHKKVQDQLKYIHRLEIENNEKQIINLKNEKLEAEVSFKNRELSTTTMHLIQRGKLLKRIKEEWFELVQDKKYLEDDVQFKRILRLLNVAERNDSDWESFSIHFDQVHSNFLSVLKNNFPELSRNDLKMCAYVKMNLSSKEIAQLMNLSIR